MIVNRRIEILKNDKWVDAEFIDLRPGYVFRMFDDPEKKEMVVGLDGKTAFKATTFPYPVDLEDGEQTLCVEMEDLQQ
jgi:hypothetical protein